jgi:HEAT repeat protein
MLGQGYTLAEADRATLQAYLERRFRLGELSGLAAQLTIIGEAFLIYESKPDFVAALLVYCEENLQILELLKLSLTFTLNPNSSSVQYTSVGTLRRQVFSSLFLDNGISSLMQDTGQTESEATTNYDFNTLFPLLADLILLVEDTEIESVIRGVWQQDFEVACHLVAHLAESAISISAEFRKWLLAGLRQRLGGMLESDWPKAINGFNWLNATNEMLAVGLAHSNLDLWDSFVKALQTLEAKEVIPQLLPLFGYSASSVEVALVVILNKLDPDEAVPAVISLLASPITQVRSNAVVVLRELQNDQPVLTYLITDPNVEVRRIAFMVIPDLAVAERIPALITLLYDTNSDITYRALDMLSRLKSGEVITSLLASVKHILTIPVRRRVMEILKDLNPSKEVVPQLLTMLADTDSGVRWRTISILRQLRAKEAVPALLLMLNDPVAQVRSEAIHTLISLKVSGAVPLIIALLHDPDSVVRIQVLNILRGLEASEALSQLVTLLTDPERKVRAEIVDILAEFPVAESLPHLITLLQDVDSMVRLRAIKVLVKWQAMRAQIVSTCFSLLQNSNKDVCISAMEVLVRLKASEFVPALVTLLASSHAEVRWQAIMALVRLKALAALPQIVTLLHDRDQTVRRTVTKAIAELNATDMLTQVFEWLHDSYWDVRWQAISVALRLGAEEALPHIIECLNDSEVLVRRQALETLVKFNLHSAVPHLLPLLADPDLTLRKRLMSILANSGTPTTLPLLEPMLNHTDSEVRQRAVSVRRRIQRRYGLTH